MPTLQFKGKNTIWNHHLSIPYYTLDEITDLDYKPKDGEGNLIIEGDNLTALKALLPNYRGKIKCIYIDPPYNTGNENWVYNDNVNNALMKEWLGKVVGKDDMTKHDKWLCMIVPRLKLLRELLSEDGAIFISIDDNEMNNLKSIMNEIFGEASFISDIVWKGKGGGADNKFLMQAHEYLILYSKSKFIVGEEEKSNESFPKYDILKKRNYKTQLARKWGSNSRRIDRPNLYYSLNAPDKSKVYPKLPDGSDGCWRWSKTRMDTAIENNDVEFIKDNNEWIIYEKIYEPVEGELNTKKYSTWFDNYGTTANGSNELKELFTEKVFNYPKPTLLIKTLLKVSKTTKDDIILDSFAGSGTTAQAVMDLNAEDGGKRKFILIQMKEETKDEPDKNICKDITRERVKRAIDKYKYKSGFKYLRVGIPIDAETMLAGNLPDYKQLAKFVFYLCTGENLSDTKSINEKNYFAGKFGSSAIYLIYKKNFESLKNLALTLELAEKFKKENKKKRLIIYAPACFLDEEYLTENQISFVGIPYNLFEKV